MKVLFQRDIGAVRTTMHRLEKLQTSMSRVITIGFNLGLLGTAAQLVEPNSVAWIQMLARPTVLRLIIAAIDRGNDYVCKTLKRSTLSQTILGIKTFIHEYGLAVEGDVYQRMQQWVGRIGSILADILPTAAEIARDSHKLLVDVKAGQPYISHQSVSDGANAVRMLAEDLMTRMESRGVTIVQSKE